MTVATSILDRTLAALPRMRVCVVTETWPPEVNGVALTVERCVHSLRERGHDVRLVRPRQSGDTPACRDVLTGALPIPGYPALRMGLPSGRRLRHLWRHWRPDVVHVITEGPLGWSALRAAARLDIPVVADFHTNFHSYGRHYGWGGLTRLIYRYLRHFHNAAHCTLVPTRAMRTHLQRDGFSRLEVVARGVDTTLFHPGQRSATLRAQWGLQPGQLAVLHVGRLAAEKNLPLLLQAFAAIRRQRPDARLVLVGDGPAQEALQREQPHHVFAGVQRGAALAAHFASADLFLFPSLTETFGNVTLEAMASGLPVVAFDYAAAAEHITHGTNGWLAPYQDSAAFLSGAGYLATQDALRLRLGRAAVQDCAQLGWSQVMDDLERALSGSARLLYSEMTLHLSKNSRVPVPECKP